MNNFIDLGLPSGLLWSDRNIGSRSQFEYGSYFLWNEIIRDDSKTIPTYADFQELLSNTKPSMYAEIEGKLDLIAKGKCKGRKIEWEIIIPTMEQLSSLRFMMLESKVNGNSLIIPASGYIMCDSFFPDDCILWSSSPYYDYSPESFILSNYGLEDMSRLIKANAREICRR